MVEHVSERLSKNNFDFLRLLFAFVVCLVHAYQLSGFKSLSIIVDYFSSEVAVKSFFVVSGFLIFMSYERSSSVLIYAKKRFLRIYPAYFSIIIGCAIFLVFVSSKSIGDYFSYSWVSYVFSNMVFLNFLQPELPGVFQSNSLAAVNGALWTLKIEVMFYLVVPVLALLIRRFSPIAVILAVYILSVGYSGVMAFLAERTGSGFYVELARQLPGQLSYFIAGAAIYYYLPLFERFVGYFVAVAVAIYIYSAYYSMSALEPIALAILVIFFSLYFYLGNFGKYGDFSYGFYILHFPVIQIFLNFGWFGESPWFFLLVIVLVVFCGSVVMWHFVEKNFLFRGNHYVSANSKVDNGSGG